MNLDKTRGRFSEYLQSIGALLLLNVVLGSTKLVLGYVGHSSAMRSDGWNNSADFLYSIFLAVGIWLSTRPPDQSHPEGHERFESLIGVFVALVILGTGGYVLWDSIHMFFNPSHIELGALGLTVLVVSMALKAIIAWFLSREGSRLESPSLDAIGRDQAGDVLADLSVVAAIVASYSRYFWIDPAVAAVIGVLILKLGWDPLTENIDHLTGRAPGGNIVQQIEDQVTRVDGFSNPSNVRVHHVGPRLHVSLRVKVRGERTINSVHSDVETLRKAVLRLERVERVYIRVEPFEAESSG